jgi:hypothetical protein
LIAALCADIDRSKLDTGVLTAYVAALGACEIGTADLSGAAAERLYLSKLFARVACVEAAFAPIGAEFAALTRRWYFAHTMAGEGAAPERVARMLTYIGARERVLCDQVLKIMVSLGE